METTIENSACGAIAGRQGRRSLRPSPVGWIKDEMPIRVAMIAVGAVGKAGRTPAADEVHAPRQDPRHTLGERKGSRRSGDPASHIRRELQTLSGHAPGDAWTGAQKSSQTPERPGNADQLGMMNRGRQHRLITRGLGGRIIREDAPGRGNRPPALTSETTSDPDATVMEAGIDLLERYRQILPRSPARRRERASKGGGSARNT
jgi:hypothetical protein